MCIITSTELLETDKVLRTKLGFMSSFFTFIRRNVILNLKKPLGFPEQISKLKEHNLIISDEQSALEVLSKINYYRFSGYALQFRKEPGNSDLIDGITFERVYSIYLFDEAMRDICRKYLEKAEIYYKTQISHNFTLKKCSTPPYDQHYDENNYYYKQGYNEVMDSFKKEKNYYKDSLIVKHHTEKYSNKMPLWVIFELMSFSNTSKLYGCMYFSEKDLIAKAVGTGMRTLENHLHCLSVLRNKCSHAARMYNTKFYPPAKFPSKFYRRYPSVSNDSLFAYILVLIKRLPDQKDKDNLINDVSDTIKKYAENIDLMLIGFPVNYEDIMNNNK